MSSSKGESFGLKDLIAPLSQEDFLANHWPDALYVCHGAAARLAPLSEIPELASARALARVHHESVITYLPPEVAERERRVGGRVRATEAVELYDRGARLEFNQVCRWVPELAEHMKRIERDLGMPRGTLTCSFFAMPPGARVLPHFDTQPAICIQLKGAKRWSIGREPTMAAPLQNHVLGTTAPEIARYHSGPLPEEMPADAIEVDMVPGSVLYLPRGHAHATTSFDHTLSLTLDINLPTWADLLVRGLRARLDRIEAWRRHVVEADPAQRCVRRQELARMLPDVTAAVAELVGRPDDVLDAARPQLMPGAQRHFRRRPGARMELVEEHAGHGGWQLRVEHPELGVSEIGIASELVPLCRWIVAQDATFVDADASYAGHTASASDVVTTLTALLETGALEGVRP